MKFTIGFILTALFVAVTFWLGGYDFNYRDPFVGYCFAVSVVISVFGGMLSAEVLK